MSFSRLHNCPICGNTDQSCSIDNFTQVISCRKSNGQETEGYKFLYTSINGYSNYIKSVDGEGKPVSDADILRLMEIQKKQKADFLETKPTINLLSRLLNRLPTKLQKDHKEDLLRRGLTEAQIIQGRFGSLVNGLKYPVNSSVPGFLDSGEFVGATGYICFARNTEGQLIGFQMRTKSKSNKYVWTKAESEDQELINNYLLKSGEAPITYCPGDKTDVVYLCEGLLKPFITSKRFNVTVVGAASGQFLRSRQQLEAIKDLHPKAKFVLLCDSGCAINPNVTSAYVNLAKFLRSLNIHLYYGNWGQWDVKLDGNDCDEINSNKFFDMEFMASYAFKPTPFQISNQLVNYMKDIMSDNRAKIIIERKTGIPYIPGTLPRYKPGHNLSYQFDRDTRKQFFQEAYSKGYTIIADLTSMGRGKSYQTGLLSNWDFKHSEGVYAPQLWYFSKQHRAPTTPTIESNFDEYPTRHMGLVAHPTKRTPLGNKVWMRPTKETATWERSPANCFQADKQTEIYQSGYKTNICRKCKLQKDCNKGVGIDADGDGFGYRFLVKQIVEQSTNISANIQGVSPKNIEPDSVVFIDEFSQTLPFVKTMTITAKEYKEVHGYLAARGMLISAQILKILEDGHVDYFHGMSLYDMHQEFDLDFSLGAKAMQAEEQIKEEAMEFGKKPPKLWLGDLFNILVGNKPGSLTLNKGNLTIMVRDESILEKLNVEGVMYVFMDATATKEYLSICLGIPDANILQVEDRVSPTKNLTITQVKSLSSLGKQRTDKQIQAVAQCRDYFNEKYKDRVGFIDWKCHTKKGDLTHFVDGRGSNAFENKRAVVAFGCPNPNLGAILAEYETLVERVVNSKIDTDFKHFYESCIQAEIEQEVGRLRAANRVDQDVDYYIFSNRDLYFLAHKGYQVNQLFGHKIDEKLGNDKLLIGKKSELLLEKLIELAKTGELDGLSVRDTAKLLKWEYSGFYRLCQRQFGSWGALKLEIAEMIESQELSKLHREIESLKMKTRSAALVRQLRLLRSDSPVEVDSVTLFSDIQGYTIDELMVARQRDECFEEIF